MVKYYVNATTTGAAIQLINQHIDKISSKIFSLNDLISDTLTISKIDEGKVDVTLELIDLVELSESMVKFILATEVINDLWNLMLSGRLNLLHLIKN